MSKEFIRRSDFIKPAAISLMENEEALILNEEQLADVAKLYEGALDNLSSGKLIQGTILKVDNDGVLVDISFKSDGFIPRYEFSEHELKKLKPGDDIEVILDELESLEGNVCFHMKKQKQCAHGMQLPNSLKKANLLKVLLLIKLRVA